MEMNEIYKLFLEIEDENRLYEKKIEDVFIWQYVKHYVYMDISHKLISRSKSDCTEKLSRVNKLTPKQILKKKVEKGFPFNSKENFLFFEQKDALFLIYNCRAENRGYGREKYMEGYLTAANISYYALEWSFAEEDVRDLRPKTDNLKYVSDQMIISLFGNEKKYDNNKVREEFLREFIDIFEIKFKISLDYEYLWERVKCCLRRRDSYLRYYKFILRQIRPKIAIFYNYAECMSHFFVEAAKKEGIPTVEIAHGYSHYREVVYTNLSGRKPPSLPDYFFDKGKANNELMENYLCKRYVIGSPELEKKVKTCVAYLKSTTPYILIIGTPAMNFTYVLKKLCSSRQPYKVVLKLHPAEFGSHLRNRYQQFEAYSNVEIIKDDTYDCLHYIKRTDLVIGDISTALFEALAFKKSILIYRNRERKGQEILPLYQKAIERGLFSYFDDTSDVDNVINECISKEIDEKALKDYWAENSAKRFNKAIAHIINTNFKA